MQPGATPFFRGKGATRLAEFPTGQKETITVRFLIVETFFAPKRSKKSDFSETARAGATGK
ncbi:hypothetical protein ACTORR_16640 [Pseudomonas sp. SAR267]|uniref:hypothetical protein n=1 Tax=unclassified Pseudomonas TaxID=196821 RepID=UPI0012E2E2F4|nr:MULTISPECIES: hypothetical protein [unclassified Pseudomonas]